MMEFLNKPLFYISETNFITWWKIIIGVSLIIFAWLISKFISKIIMNRLLKKAGINQDSVTIIQRITFFLLLTIITLIILSFLDIPLGAFAFISGAVAIGFGFGAKTIIENFLSGWILMTERPIRMGDVIEIDGNYGSIIGIGNRSTVIKRNDGAHIVIPNSQILESKLINLSAINPNIRTSIKVGVSYGTDIELVKQLLFEIAKSHPLIDQSVSSAVIFEDFGDNALVFDLFFWIPINSGGELRQVRSDIRFAVSKKFTEHGIVIAFPQRDVHHHFDAEITKNISKGFNTNE